MKYIKGYEGFYSVDRDGLVWSHRRAKYLSPGSGSSGYLSVTITKDGKPKCFSVHRLVAMAFIENPEGKPQVNHKDGNKLNNNVENLEWATCSENMAHAVKIGLHKGGVGGFFKSGDDPRRRCGKKFTKDQVLDMRNRWGNGESFEDINKTYNVDSSTIRRVCKGQTYRTIM
jgi:hypothetical protein